MIDARPASAGAPATLLLLHGLGAHSGVWAAFIDAIGSSWAGPILALDLPGHGKAQWTGAYGIGQQASAIASSLLGVGPVTIVAHSMGGLVGLALATGWFGVTVERVLAVGVKVDWSDAERHSAAGQACKPIKWFDDRDAAVERFLKVAGLSELSLDAGLADGGVIQDGSRWRLRADPATPSVGGPDMARVMAAVPCTVRLARGVTDPLVTLAALRRFDPAAIDLQGGHNTHVDHPTDLAEFFLTWAVVE